MQRTTILTDVQACRRLWEELVPRENLWDLWDVRDCFHRCFRRPLQVILLEEGGRTEGFLPLSWIEETRTWAYFPGETWHGRTWIERNRLIWRDPIELLEVLAARAPRYDLRYLVADEARPGSHLAIDEVGYRFHPPRHGHDLEHYFLQFSHKTVKRLRRELEDLASRGIEYRLDEIADFDLMIELNLGRFGEDSYFHDGRFREAFRALLRLLDERGWLRMTTVLIEGRPAAVDMGCLYNGTYTLLAGGTHPDVPGVAKLINLYHMRRACAERMRCVDFLCGDFSWKRLFHLDPQPLGLVSNVVPCAQEAAGPVPGIRIHART